jgi:hypothetical protein
MLFRYVDTLNVFILFRCFPFAFGYAYKERVGRVAQSL